MAGEEAATNGKPGEIPQTNGKHKAEGEPAGTPPSKKRLHVEEQKEAPSGIVETGRVYWIAKPRVGMTEITGLGDVQRFYMVLSPGGDRAESPNRLVIIGKKSLPDIQTTDRYFGFVEAVNKDIGQLTQGLGPQEYQTKSSGSRSIDPSRTLGEGVYSIVQKGPKDTSFVYKMTLPETPGEAQKEFKLPKTGSYGFCIKNPARKGAGNPGLDEKADYSKEQQKQFEGTPGGYAWTGAQDPTLLDVLKCELLFIGATENVRGELGDKAADHLDKLAAGEKETKTDGATGTDEDSAMIAEMQKELASEKAGLKTKPAEEGKLQ